MTQGQRNATTGQRAAGTDGKGQSWEAREEKTKRSTKVTSTRKREEGEEVVRRRRDACGFEERGKHKEGKKKEKKKTGEKNTTLGLARSS